MSDAKPKSSSLAAALLRYGGAALFHFLFWLVYLSLRWPFGELNPVYPPDRPDAAYFVQLGITAGIGAVALAAIQLAGQRWRARGR